jgi:putative nucleotidyltransferase with HDIG domain
MLEQARAAHAAGRWDEALEGYELLLARLPRHGGTAEEVTDLLRWVGCVRTERGEIELAGEVFEASLLVAELNDLTERAVSALICLAVLDQQRGRVAEAEAGYQQAAEMAAGMGDERLAAMAEQNLGTLASIRGEYALALAHYQSALARNRRMGDDLTAARALNNIAMAHVAGGALEEAERRFREARDHATRAGDALMVGMIGLNCADLHLRRRELELAESACRESLEVFTRLRSKRWIGEAYKFQGILHRERGDSPRSSACFSMALGLAEVSENCLLQAETQMEWSVIHLQRGRAHDGIRYLNAALRLFGQMQARRELLDLREQLERAEGLYLPAVARWAEERLSAWGMEEVRHAHRVADLSAALASSLGMDGWDLMVTRVGALLHDLGKTVIGLPHGAGSGRAEPRLLKAHPVVGDAILAQLDFPAEVRALVRHHHEQPCGGGYPDGLAGEEVPMGARIVAIANTFDRLVHAPGSSGRTPGEAVREMECSSGRVHDPAVLAALARLVEMEPAPGSWSGAPAPEGSAAHAA